MIGEKVLVLGFFMASWTILSCQGTARHPNSDFNQFDILSNQNQNRLGHGVNEVRNHIYSFVFIKYFFQKNL